jgi:ATP-dependent helicase Lhr and Lhr-like helicase
MDGAVDRLRAVANARDRGEPLPGPNGAHGTQGTGAPFAAAPVPDGFPPADIDWDVPGLDNALGSPPAPGDWISPRDMASPGAGGPRGGSGSPYNSGSPDSSGYADRRPRTPPPASRAVVLAAADPANAYGAALPWLEPPTGAGHKPGRKAGSLVVLVDGELTLYMERGGKTLLAWPAAADQADSPADDPRLPVAAESLAAAARAGSLGTVTVERVNGVSALTSSFGAVLEGAGFIATPRGLRLRA